MQEQLRQLPTEALKYTARIAAGILLVESIINPIDPQVHPLRSFLTRAYFNHTSQAAVGLLDCAAPFQKQKEPMKPNLAGCYFLQGNSSKTAIFVQPQ